MSAIRTVFVTIAILIATAPAFAQGQHTLQGKVHYPNGMTPSNSVKITLTFNGRRIYESFTDLSGRFNFSGVARGTYQLTAEGDGQTFETTTVYAEVSAYGSAPQNFTQNIQLSLKAGKPVTPANVVSVAELDASIPERARKEYQQGLKRADENKNDQALKHFQEAVSAHPQFYAAHVALGDLYARLKRMDEAVVAYQKALSIETNRAPAHAGLGAALVSQKKYAEAIAPLRRAVELEKSSSPPYLYLGLAEMFSGDYDSAEVHLLRAYEIGKPPIVHLYLANLYEIKGAPAKAIDHLKALLKENPNLNEERKADIRLAIEKLQKKASGKD
ncbi:MAG TPA: tetratricopeptide repeat protein [Blastocatellia bacterium]|nr:tetratricopeptide repeat protein [Blastocatellia bacterium]